MLLSVYQLDDLYLFPSANFYSAFSTSSNDLALF
jgi:hypothetical protein